MKVIDSKDIVPELQKKIKDNFQEALKKDELFLKLYNEIQQGAGDYKKANDVAVQVANNLTEAFNKSLSAEILPDERMYYNIADRVIKPMLLNSYKIVADITVKVQSTLNTRAGISIKGISAPVNMNRINGIVNKISNYSKYKDAAWLLDAPISNFTQSVVDDTATTNAAFHKKAGLNPQIERQVNSEACKWCQERAGLHDYPTKDKTIYQRHSACKCVVSYDPKNGKRQNVWDKSWTDIGQNGKIKARESINLAGHKKTVKKTILKQKQKQETESDIQKQKSKSIKKAIKSYEKRIQEHEEYIRDPSRKMKDFDLKDIRYQEGLKRHWLREIEKFKESQDRRIKELIKRGDYDEEKHK